MYAFRYRTNLKCSDCIITLTPHLEKVTGLQRWQVDLEHPDRTLSVEVEEDVHKTELEEAIRQAGYEAIELPETSMGY